MTIITLILISLTATAFAGIRVLFPISGDTKAVSNIHVIASSDSGEPAVVSINGRETVKNLIFAPGENGKATYMLMTILKLDMGDNEIVVSQNGDKKAFKITKVDSPVSITDWTDSLNGFHKSDRTAICQNCHRFENLSDCVNCHRDKFIGQWVHKPVKEAKCFECHERQNNFVPQEPFAETCLKCHVDVKKGLESAQFTHGPTAAGFCTICHSPHKSTDETHLRKSSNSLCRDCHVSNDQGFVFHSNSYIKFHPVDGVRVEKLDKELECSDCHNPHYASNGMLLTAEDENKLCEKCHEKQDTEKLLKVLSDKYGVK
jgi:predicted CXXCH cytochrome family protein